jgi:FkbM family methyltransferase
LSEKTKNVQIVMAHLWNFAFALMNNFKHYGLYKTSLFIVVTFYGFLESLLLSARGDLEKAHIIEVNGYKLSTIPYDTGISKELLIFKMHEPIACQLLKKELKSGMVVLDVGSNIGLYVLLERKFVGKEGRVIAVEPSKKALFYLRRNIQLNGFDDIETHELAVTSDDKWIDFLVHPKSNMSRVVDANRHFPEGVVVKVPGRSLDSFVESCYLDRLDLIRMDVEGHEYQIYNGGRRTIARFKPALLVEVHTPQMGPKRSANFLANLRNDGYVVKYFIQRELEPLEFFGACSKKEISAMRLEQLQEKLIEGQLPPVFTIFLENATNCGACHSFKDISVHYSKQGGKTWRPIEFE